MPDIGTSFPSLTKRFTASIFCFAVLVPLCYAQGSLSLLDRMEPGSIIKDLLIPQYNDNLLATVVLRMDQATILPNSRVQADNTSIHLIRSDTAEKIGSTILRIDQCFYDVKSKLLDSTSPARATSARLDIQSQGLICSLEDGEKNQQFFLRPPVIGFINPREIPPETSMKTPRTLASALLLSIAATAQEPKSTTPPDAPDLTLLTIQPKNQAAEDQLLAFAKKHNIPLQSVTPPPLPATALAPIDPAQEIPSFKATADALGFSCAGGVFYSSATNTLTFLEQITMRDPAYAMTVKGKVLLTFVPNAPEKKAATAENQPTPAPENEEINKEKSEQKEKEDALGKLSTIRGEGGVAFEATDKDGVKNFAAGDSILYDQTTQIATLTGRRIIFQKGTTTRFESMNSDAWLKFNRQTKDFSMSDGWKAILEVPKDQKTDKTTEQAPSP
jgi:hypothetical protein